MFHILKFARKQSKECFVIDGGSAVEKVNTAQNFFYENHTAGPQPKKLGHWWVIRCSGKIT